MSLCDACLSPGACCKRMVLNSSLYGPGLGPQSRESAEHLALRLALPFFPARQREDGIWEWACTELQPDGRCGAYEDRPQVCRDYAAGSDALCVHYWPDPDDIGIAKRASSHVVTPA